MEDTQNLSDFLGNKKIEQLCSNCMNFREDIFTNIYACISPYQLRSLIDPDYYCIHHVSTKYES